MGVVTSLGAEVTEMWESLLQGHSGVRKIRQFDSADFPVNIGSEVDLDRITIDYPDEIAPLISRSARFGIWALDKAWLDAGLNAEDVDPFRSGVCIGAWNCPTLEQDIPRRQWILNNDSYDAAQYLALCKQIPDLLPQRDPGTVPALLSMRHSLQGICTCVQTACASATQAVGEAYHAIREGDADLMVTGGTDSMLSAICVTGFTLLTATSTFQGDPARACRPFDRKRDGLVLGEGAGIVILEELEHAQRRRAHIHSEIIGYGSSCDGYRFTDSHPEGFGAIRCMNAALDDAGIQPTAIDYVNAHGTSTPQNDRVETLALKRVFGERAYELPISSTKSQVGHLMCAAGGIELVITVLSMQHAIAPPTINLEHPDPDCDLDYIPNEPRRLPIQVALSNSFGFGGQNGSVILSKWDGQELIR
jgi:3-oxoacyl-[acyl-carrier-protein] synthase II